MAFAIPQTKLIRESLLIGTHDTMTYSLKWPYEKMAKTQRLNIQQQLDLGVQFFDMRLKKVNGLWRIGHGLADTGFTLDYFVGSVKFGLWSKNPYQSVHLYILINNGLSPATVPTTQQLNEIKAVLGQNIDYSDTLTNIDCLGKFVLHTGFDGVAGYNNQSYTKDWNSQYNLLKTDSQTLSNPVNGVHKLVQFNSAGFVDGFLNIDLPYPEGFSNKLIPKLKADIKSGAFKVRPYMYWLDFADAELINLLKTKLI